jgi:putative ABC transport system permease protein
MIRFAFKTLTDHPVRYIITACGIGLCVILILFLMGIYRGVADGSVEYVRSSLADLWVLQRHATNILRSTSLLKPSHGRKIKEVAGVSNVSPVLFILAAVELPNGPQTLYLTGYEPVTGDGGPPTIVEGRNIGGDSEIVIDRSFAAKNRIEVGDTLQVKNYRFAVAGLSGGTNMFVIQYAFISLADAHRIIGVAGIVTCYQVLLEAGADPVVVSQAIEDRMPDVVAFGREEFLANNIREMESGILSLLFTVSVLGSVVLTVILSLILSINVLERRKDYAIMKALGSPEGFIPRLVVLQSVMLSLTGLALGILAHFPAGRLVERLSPEVSLTTTTVHMAAVILVVLAISLVSAVIPIQKLKRIYPLEAFR